MKAILEKIRVKSLIVRNLLIKQNHEEIWSLNEMMKNSPPGYEDAQKWISQAAELLERNLLNRISKKDMSLILAGLMSYRNTGITPQMSHMALMRAYENTSGLMQEILHIILFEKNTREKTIENSKFFGDLSAPEIEMIQKELLETGYVVMPSLLKASLVDAFVDEAKQFNYKLRNPTSDQRETVFRKIDPLIPPLCIAAYANSSDLKNSNLFSEFSNDPLLLRLASIYMGTSVFPIDSTLWYSFAASASSGDAAQMFHYDLDTLRWLKIFVYLTDVGPGNGPHEFVPATHKPGSIPQRLINRGYMRLEDQEVDKYFVQSRQKIYGKRGTVILGDTRCLHKGNVVDHGYRLIFSPIYAPSRIGYFHGF
jgi:hypothetical protein